MKQQFDIKNGSKNERKSLNKLRRSELLELISDVTDTLEDKILSLSKEKEKNRAFERVLISKNYHEYFREFSKTISTKETSSIRILFSKNDFFLQPFSVGYGLLSDEYNYLDDQISDQLGGKSHLLIQDTSKAHNIKFLQGKSYPRSIIAFPIIHNDHKVGCIWIGDENYRAYSKREIKEFDQVIGEYQNTLTVLFKTISTSQEIFSLRQVFDSIKEPVLIINKQQIITQANSSAIKEFNLIRGENESFISEKSDFINSFHSPDATKKIHIRNNDKDFEVVRLGLNSLGIARVTCYRFIDKSRERALNKYFSTIISTIINFLRTPMIEIKGLASLISSMGNLSEKQKEFLDSMGREIFRIENNVKELMSIDRLNNEGFIEINEVAIGECLDDAIITLTPLAEQKQITIRSDHGNQRKIIFSDAVLLNHALLNILDYSIRESHMGGIVEINCSNQPNAFLISIKDFGKGISKFDINKIMDDKSFDQYTDELEITKSIMKILNGDILVESNLGSGTIITLKIPQIVS